MIHNSHDLLLRIAQNNGILNLSEHTPAEFGIDSDSLETYIEDLESKGYINRYVRSIGITPEGSEFLKD